MPAEDKQCTMYNVYNCMCWALPTDKHSTGNVLHHSMYRDTVGILHLHPHPPTYTHTYRPTLTPIHPHPHPHPHTPTDPHPPTYTHTCTDPHPVTHRLDTLQCPLTSKGLHGSSEPASSAPQVMSFVPMAMVPCLRWYLSIESNTAGILYQLSVSSTTGCMCPVRAKDCHFALFQIWVCQRQHICPNM